MQRSLAGTLMVGFVMSAMPATAFTGDPVAIRHLPGGGFAIESMWNLSVVISIDSFETDQRGGVDVAFSGVRPDGLLQSSERFLLHPAAAENRDYVLDRPANQAKPSWQPFSESAKKSPNAIRVRTFADSNLVVVDVDGLRVALRHQDDKSDASTQQALSAVDAIDVMILTSRGSTADLIRQGEPDSSRIGPRILIVAAKGDAAAVANTVAVAASDVSDTETRRTIMLSSEPLKLSPELSMLMEKKEASCEASQEVFAALSVNQMNFRPSNGSHTPRWNAEHMMGRELLFFSQIFHSLDPTIPVMDLNPKQMPPDYVARHADWTGEEEARQMERVLAFTRRYVHLIKDLPLDEKAPASGWTPRGLLRQMERHYNEHTANVKKKFLLEDWPQE